jgi:hypothetical protein
MNIVYKYTVKIPSHRGPCMIGVPVLEYGIRRATYTYKEPSIETYGYRWIYPCNCVGKCSWSDCGLCEYELIPMANFWRLVEQ